MKGLLRSAGIVAATAVMTLALVGLSRVPWSAAPGDDGALRLAWQYKSQPVERCRTATPEELAKLPPHMRRTTICERGLRPYVLEVSVDGGAARVDTVRARGARADRPLGVFAQVPLAPGAHAIRVAFSPAGGDHAPLTLDTTLVLAPRQVWLVTLDGDRGTLVLRDRLPAGD
jgi:hypothetical protein